MLRDNEADDGAAVAEAADNDDENAAAIWGAIEATPAPLFNPMVRLLTGPSADCAETELTDEEGAAVPLWETGAAEVAEEGGGTEEGATAETDENDEECKMESQSRLGCSRLVFEVRTEEGAKLFCCVGRELLC